MRIVRKSLTFGVLRPSNALLREIHFTNQAAVFVDEKRCDDDVHVFYSLGRTQLTLLHLFGSSDKPNLGMLSILRLEQRIVAAR